MEQSALRARPERTAWLVVWSAFAAFVLLVVFVPLGVRHVLLYSTVSHPTGLRTLEGTAVVDNPATGREFSVTKGDTESERRPIDEKFVVSLDENSRADLHFFDGSSLHLRPGTRLALEQVRGPRFSYGVTPATIRARLVGGRAKIVTTVPPTGTGLRFVLRCSVVDAEMTIEGDGVFGVELEGSTAEVFANRGSAVVTAGGDSVRVVAPERLTIRAGEKLGAPIADAREFISNGGFQNALDEDWEVINDQGNDGGSIDGHAVRTTDEGLPAVHFYRTDSQRNHCETKIKQEIGRDLPDPVDSLEVRAYLKLTNQSLSGGGQLGSEFPLIIRLKYRDMYGSENDWVKGFYYENPQSNPVGSADQVPRDSWYYYESGNLLETLEPKPFHIIWLKVSASGWDYESMVRWVSLAVQ